MLMRKVEDIEGEISHWRGVRDSATRKLSEGHPATRLLQREFAQAGQRLKWLAVEWKRTTDILRQRAQK